MQRNTSGFTIIELLIVIVIIAILTVITLVAYNNIQNRAYNTTVQADLENMAKKFMAYQTINGTYPPSVTELSNVGAQATKSAYLVTPNTTYNVVPCITTGAADFSISAISKSGNKYYVGSQSGGVKQYTGPDDWTSASGYSLMCSDSLPGSALPSGSGAPGYGGAWRPWVAG